MDSAAQRWARGDQCEAILIHDPTLGKEFALAALKYAPQKAYGMVLDGHWHVSSDVLHAFATHAFLEQRDTRLLKRYVGQAKEIDDLVAAYAQTLERTAPNEVVALGTRMNGLDRDTADVRNFRHSFLRASREANDSHRPLIAKLCNGFLIAKRVQDAFECLVNAGTLFDTPGEQALFAEKVLVGLPSLELNHLRKLEAAGVGLVSQVGRAARCDTEGFVFTANRFRFPESRGSENADIIMNLARSAPRRLVNGVAIPSTEALCFYQVAALLCIEELIRSSDCHRPDSLAAFAGSLEGRLLSEFVDAVYQGKVSARVRNDMRVAFALHVTLGNVLPIDKPREKGSAYHQQQAEALWRKAHPGRPFVRDDFFFRQ